MRPTIAVIGSLSPDRSYDPPGGDSETAQSAAAEIGRELAARGCRILVFSGRPEFIESAVVRGFVESRLAPPGSVEVRARFGADSTLPGMTEHRADFTVLPDSSGDWEVAFFRSLLAVDGVVLVGGGRSTFAAGLIALSRRIAIAPVAVFGGAAQRIWQRMTGDAAHATEEDVAVFAGPWHPGSAAEVVAALLAQHERARAEQELSRRQQRATRRRAVAGLAGAVALLLVALATIPLAFAIPPGRWPSLSVLVGAAVLASVWGAVVRNAYDGGAEWLRAAALGSAAGCVAFLLYVAAQMSTNPDLFTGDTARRLIFFVLAIAFIGGFTSEVVYRKLRDQDVTQTSGLPPAGL